jgi:predicted secreted protein
LSCRDLLDTTLCDKVCHTEMYLIQHYVIKFVMQRCTWYNIIMLYQVHLCMTNFITWCCIKYISHDKLYHIMLYQVHLAWQTLPHNVVSSTSLHDKLYRDVLDTTWCDKVCHTEMYLIRHHVIKFVIQRCTWYNIMW